MTDNQKQLRVTLKRSVIGILPVHKMCVTGLGLRKTGNAVLVNDSPENRGMINKVSYLLAVEEI